MPKYSREEIAHRRQLVRKLMAARASTKEVRDVLAASHGIKVCTDTIERDFKAIRKEQLEARQPDRVRQSLATTVDELRELAAEVERAILEDGGMNYDLMRLKGRILKDIAQEDRYDLAAEDQGGHVAPGQVVVRFEFPEDRKQ